MRKFFYILGVLFALVIIGGGIGIVVLVRSTAAIDAEGKAYVDDSLTAILPSWNKDELLKRASAQFKKAGSPEDLGALFDAAAAALGPLVEYKGAKGQGATVSQSVGSGTVATATYVAEARFEKGGASITVAVRKVDGHWIIDGFSIGSSELMRHMTGRGT